MTVGKVEERGPVFLGVIVGAGTVIMADPVSGAEKPVYL
jgi:hypothetical protein